jgi:hypothetical protein
LYSCPIVQIVQLTSRLRLDLRDSRKHFSDLPDWTLLACIRWTRRNLWRHRIFNLWGWNIDVWLRWRRIVLRHLWLFWIFDPRKFRHGWRVRRWHNDRRVQFWNDQPERQSPKARGFLRENIFERHETTFHGDVLSFSGYDRLLMFD